jgi:hypothetical protein
MSKPWLVIWGDGAPPQAWTAEVLIVSGLFQSRL